jgi:hypothetical protein
MRKHGILTICTVGMLSMLLIAGKTYAAPAEEAGAIRVSPAITNLQLKTTQTNATVTALITNLTDTSIAVALSSKDFGALNETGTVGLYSNSYNPSTNPHSLQGVVSFPSGTIALSPHQTQKVKIDLDDLDSLAVGGHFGAVLFTPESPAADDSKPNVSIRSSVASLIFLTTATGGTSSLQLLSFHTGTVAFSLPSLNYVGFHNSGNTQAAVTGQITLYGPSGAIVSTAVVNPGSGLVLPGTSRVFPVALSLNHALFAMPGRYRLRLQYRAGVQRSLVTINDGFFYVNLAVIGPCILLVALLIYVVRKWGKRAIRSAVRLARKLVRLFRRKKPVPVPVVERPKKRRPPLIQG